MNKFLLTMFLSCLSFVAMAQEVSQTYYFDAPEIVEHQGYTMVEFDNTMQSAVLGNPMLPYQATQILLPPGCEAVDVTLEYGKLIPLTQKGVLFPKQAVRPISHAETGEFFKNEDVYNSKSKYPSENHGVLTTHFYRGHSIANVAFTPVVYIPAEGTLSYYESVTVTLTTQKTQKASDALNLLKKTDDISIKVDNVAAVAQYDAFIPSAKSLDNYDMIIISQEQYENKFDTLISFYRNYGIFAQFKSLSSIYSEMDGVDNQEKIRNYIIQEYTDHSIEYVLLGGDSDVFPYRGFFCVVESSSTYTDNGIPADVYFSALDGTWNDDNDSHWGEIGEDDLYLEVSVSRMPFSNNTDLDNILNKVLKFQQSPIVDELDKVAMLGEWMYDNPDSWGSDYLNLLIGEHDDNGYTTIGIHEDHPIDSLYEQHDGFSKNQVIQKINAGNVFVHHAGHANETFVMSLNNNDITNNTFYAVDGETHNYNFVYSHGCYCGSFDYNDCITEKMVTLENFAVSVTSNSRYGWFNEGQTEGPSAHLNREFVDAVYHDKYNRYGKAQKESKTATAPWVNAPGQWEEGALRWCFYCSNSLGDPATQIWIEAPYELSIGHEAFLHPEADTFRVVVYNLTMEQFEAGANVLMLHGEELVGKGVSDEEGECIVDIVGEIPESGIVRILVSGYNTMVKEYSVTIGGTDMKGDANMDGGVSILDVVATVAYIAEEDPQPFNFNLADVNNDGQVDVSDIIGIVNIIFGTYNLDNCSSNEAVYSIEDGVLYVDSPVDIAGVQFIFSDSVAPVSELFGEMEVVSKRLTADRYMFMAYSNDGNVISAGRNAILSVEDAILRKIVLSDEFGCKITPVEDPLAIEEFMSSEVKVYPNPFNASQTFEYVLSNDVQSVDFVVFNSIGEIVDRLYGSANCGANSVVWNPSQITSGLYFVNMYIDGIKVATYKTIYNK